MTRLGIFLRQQNRLTSFLLQQGYRLTVDASKCRVIRRLPIDLFEPMEPEPEGMEYWRSVSMEVWFGQVSAFVDFSVRQVQDDQTHVELWFPSKIFQSIFNFDAEQRQFNTHIKSDLMRLCIGIAKELGASGFGYRVAEEDSLFGPLTVESLRDYVEIGNRWFPKRHELKLRIAGVAVPYVEESQFEYDMDDHPTYYRQSGYYIWDMLWPR